jgi:integrase
LPYAELPRFLIELRGRENIAARAMEYLVLTAARAGEVLGARWNEINLDDATWTVPATRMKAGKEHRVPLSDRAIAILQKMQALRPAGDASAFVFPGRPGRGFSNTSLWEALQSMGRGNITAHGFRSTFRDWAADLTNYPDHVVEQALAHTIGSAVERAYRRTDVFEQRRRLMDAWADYCTTEQIEHGKVVAMHGR